MAEYGSAGVEERSVPPRPGLWVACAVVGGLVAGVLGGCAATGPHSPQARPVIYASTPQSAAVQQRQQADIDDCIQRAQAQGLTPDEKNNETQVRAAKGAATGGVAAAVGALVTGRNVGEVARAGAAGAAVGGATGAVSGAMNERPNHTYRNYVGRCLGDRGHQVIGWN